ncbi:aminopeptidase N [Shewanella algae]|uniref:aminopeptidase N n=1 Tax=Shewanella algae TaxID=38313 RepID=UPI0031F56C9A
MKSLPRLFGLSLLAAGLLSLSGCSSTQSSAGVRDGSGYISEQQAMARSTRVSNVSYELDFTLDGSERFANRTLVRFSLSDNQQPLTLDLSKAQITSLKINGHRLYPKYNGAYLEISAKLLLKGDNEIEVSFTRQHSSNGEGLHRFVDPVDGKVYLYSHFEPAAAQQMFAVFDQPDLKASYKLTVRAPKDWQVISATQELSVTPEGDSQLWQFPATPKLSPYNFSMHAGPYHVWQDNSGKYPMRLFARQSVAAQVNAADWFRYTDAGLKFFDDYFGIDYPFKKYDQLLVPDFLYGAMENAAAITFAEGRFLGSGEMTANQRQRLASVIMHEMAHQWFGDLVTMKWWNGLWLNESFASFMGMLASAEATEFDNTWRSFYARGKQSAYQQDSGVTTHPIEVPVASSANAFDNIDAITYQKGAAVLIQLRHLLGEQTFRRGVSEYLKRYSWQNATLEDFITSLGQAAKRDLSQWTRDWLYSAGVNSLKAEFQCQDGRISEFALLQSASDPAYPTLREQKVQLALLSKGRHEMHLLQTLAVTYQGEKTLVPQLKGASCPDLVYPNYQDWGYVKVELDPRSFDTAFNHLAKVEDPLLRAMLWQSLWDSVQSGNLPLNKYLETVLINAPKESDYTLLGQILGNMRYSKALLESMAPIHSAYAERAIRALAQMSLRLTMQNADNKDLQRRWFDAYVDFARDGDSLDHLLSLLQGHSKIKGVELDQDTRWQLIYQLNRYDYPTSKLLLQQEAKLDNSDSGQKAAIAAEVVRPETAGKRRWLEKINHSALPFAKLRVAMENLYPSSQGQLQASTAEQRLSQLATLDAEKGPVFMRSYAPALLPRQCSHASVLQLEKALQANPELSAMTQRNLKQAIEREQRCVLIKDTLKP